MSFSQSDITSGYFLCSLSGSNGVATSAGHSILVDK